MHRGRSNYLTLSHNVADHKSFNDADNPQWPTISLGYLLLSMVLSRLSKTDSTVGPPVAATGVPGSWFCPAMDGLIVPIVYIGCMPTGHWIVGLIRRRPWRQRRVGCGKANTDLYCWSGVRVLATILSNEFVYRISIETRLEVWISCAWSEMLPSVKLQACRNLHINTYICPYVCVCIDDDGMYTYNIYMYVLTSSYSICVCVCVCATVLVCVSKYTCTFIHVNVRSHQPVYIYTCMYACIWRHACTYACSHLICFIFTHTRI